MKAVILDGSSSDGAALDGIRDTLVDELEGRAWEVEPIVLRDLEIHHCLGCFGCWLQTPGTCVIDDAGRQVARAMIQSDLIVLLTPVTFGGYSSELKKALDRFACPNLLPFFARVRGEVHHRPRYAHNARLVAVGVLPQADEESERIFATLVGRNAINTCAPVHAAGVVFGHQGPHEVRARLQALLSAVGVG